MATSFTTLFVILNTNYIKIASSLKVLVQIRRVLVFLFAHFVTLHLANLIKKEVHDQ